MEKSSPRTRNYRTNTSLTATKLATFREQMADFARAERLRGLREQRHLSQEDASHEIGVTVKSLRAWEKGGGIRWGNAKSVATFYGVDPESLVSREPGELGAINDAELEPIEARIERKLDAILDHLGITVEPEAEPADDALTAAADVAAALDPDSGERASKPPPT